MDHSLIKRIIADQHEVIRNAAIVERPYPLDPAARYVLTGLRRTGKSTLLYQMARDLVSSGVSWDRIVYVNFEDERLADFSRDDFNDIVAVSAELSDEPAYFFLDEPQLVDGWERFARRLADAGEHVQITGSNARMLSSQIATTLGGRYLDRHVYPYSFGEYLTARDIPAGSLTSTKARARAQRAFFDYLHWGGLPEVLRYQLPREYLESVYQKVLLGDIATRNEIRNPQALRLLMKKVAETVRGEISATRLRGLLKEIGLSLSTDTIIDYLGFAEDAYLITHVTNAVARFAEREGTPKYYFSDTGLLGMLLVDKDTALLENLVACELQRRNGDGVYFLKSPKTGIDLDFVVPDEGLAVQAAYALNDESRDREIRTLLKLARNEGKAYQRYLIVTAEQDDTIEQDDTTIEVISAARFLLEE